MLQFAPSDNQSQAPQQASNAPSDLFAQAHSADKNRSILENAVHSVVGRFCHDESSTRTAVESGVAEFATAVPLFMGGGRGYVLSAALYGLNQAKYGDSSGNQLTDMGLGALKGLASKATFEYVGGKENWNFAAKGVTMGALSRAWDTGLSRQTYLGANGQTDVLGGLEKVGATSLNPVALATDVAVFGVAHFGFKWADGALAGKLSKSPMLGTAFTGSTFGFTSGALGEIQRERQEKEGFSFGKVLAKAGEQSVIMGAAATAGFKLTEAAALPQVVRNSRVSADATSGTGERSTAGSWLKGVKSSLGEKFGNAADLASGRNLGLVYGSGDVPADKGELHPAKVERSETGSTADGAAGSGRAQKYIDWLERKPADAAATEDATSPDGTVRVRAWQKDSLTWRQTDWQRPDGSVVSLELARKPDNGDSRWIYSTGKEQVPLNFDGGWMGPSGISLPKGESANKVHIRTSDAEDLRSLQPVVVDALMSDPQLRADVASWKTQNPQSVLRGLDASIGIGEGEKGFTVYGVDEAATQRIGQRLDEILKAHGLARTEPIMSENSASTAGTVGDTNRVTISRDVFQRSVDSQQNWTFNTGNVVPERGPLIKLDNQLVTAVKNEFAVTGTDRLSDVQLRAAEKKAGLQPGTLGYDSAGELTMKAVDTASEDKYHGGVYLNDTGKSPQKFGQYTDRRAVYALARAYGTDPAQMALAGASSDSAPTERTTEKPAPPPEFRVGEAVWKNGSYDQPIIVREYLGEHGGRHYVAADPVMSGASGALIEPSNSGIPLDEIVYPDLAEHDAVKINVPKGREGNFVEGSQLMVKALAENATAADVKNFFDWARGNGAGLESTMAEAAQHYGTDAARDMVRGAFAPDANFSVEAGYEDIARQGIELLKKLAVEKPSQQDIDAFQEFVKTPEAERVADAMKAAAASLARVTGNTEVVDRVERAFSPARAIDFNGAPEDYPAFIKGFDLLTRFIASGGADGAIRNELLQFARGEGKNIEPEMRDLANELGGPDGYNFIRDDIYHAGDKRLWIQDKAGDYTDYVWTDPAHYDASLDLLGKALAAVKPDLDPDIAQANYNNLVAASRMATPDVKSTILEYAEKSGNEALLSTMRDALVPERPSIEVSMTRSQAARFTDFQKLVTSRPMPTDEGVAAYKEWIVNWLRENPDMQQYVKDMAPSMESSAAVTAVDQFFGTHYLQEFPVSYARIAEIQRAARRQGMAIDGVSDGATAQSAKPIPGGKVMDMPVEDLLSTMENSSEVLRREQAAVVAQMQVGKMDSAQFARYMTWLYKTVPVSDGNGGFVGRWNMDQIHLPGASVLHRADVMKTLFEGDQAQWKFTLDALQKYLSFTPSGAPPFPDFLQNAEDLPNWLLSDINRRYILTPASPENPVAGRVSPQVEQRVAEDVANQLVRQKQAEASGKPRKGKSGPPEAYRAEMPNQRLATLETLLDSGLPPQAVSKFMEIGGQDGRLLADLLKRIQNYQSVPEFRRAIELTLSHAENLYVYNAYVRSLEDACNLGFKNPEGAARAAKLAKIAAETMLTPGSAAEQELVTGDGTQQSIIDRMANDKIKLPRPPKDFPGKPGGPGGDKGGRPGRDKQETAPPQPVTWNFGSASGAEPAAAEPAHEPAAEPVHEAPDGKVTDPDNLGQLLVESKWLTAEQLETAAAIARSQNIQLSEALVNVSMLQPEDMERFLQWAENVEGQDQIEETEEPVEPAQTVAATATHTGIPAEDPVDARVEQHVEQLEPVAAVEAQHVEQLEPVAAVEAQHVEQPEPVPAVVQQHVEQPEPVPAVVQQHVEQPEPVAAAAPGQVEQTGPVPIPVVATDVQPASAIAAVAESDELPKTPVQRLEALEPNELTVMAQLRPGEGQFTPQIAKKTYLGGNAETALRDLKKEGLVETRGGMYWLTTEGEQVWREQRKLTKGKKK